MSYVMFATICDKCKSRGPEYEAHTIGCGECLLDVCHKCAAVWESAGPDSYATCQDCANELAAASEEQSLDYFNRYIAGDR